MMSRKLAFGSAAALAVALAGPATAWDGQSLYVFNCSDHNIKICLYDSDDSSMGIAFTSDKIKAGRANFIDANGNDKVRVRAGPASKDCSSLSRMENESMYDPGLMAPPPGAPPSDFPPAPEPDISHIFETGWSKANSNKYFYTAHNEVMFYGNADDTCPS